MNQSYLRMMMKVRHLNQQDGTYPTVTATSYITQTTVRVRTKRMDFERHFLYKI